MRVLVTGATGWIGSAVVPELIAAGHEPVGLARSDASAEKLTAAGAGVVRGTLDDLDVLRAAAGESDGVIHLAFKHDVAFLEGNFPAAAQADRDAIETFGAALAGSEKPFVIASGLFGLAPGRMATEEDGRPDPDRPLPSFGGAEVRHQNGHRTLALADDGVRSAVLRLPPSVHGDGDQAFIKVIVEAARRNGVSPYVGDGANRWPAVHVRDAARLFRLALESAPAGSILHATGDDGVAFREIAGAVAHHLDVPTRSIPQEAAADHFGFLGALVGVDSPASSGQTRRRLGWEPTHPGLLADLAEDHYYVVPAATRAG